MAIDKLSTMGKTFGLEGGLLGEKLEFRKRQGQAEQNDEARLP